MHQHHFINPHYIEGEPALFMRPRPETTHHFMVSISTKTHTLRIYDKPRKLPRLTRFFYVQARNARSVRRCMNGYHGGTIGRFQPKPVPPSPEQIQIEPKNKGTRAVRHTRPAIRKETK